MKGLRRSHYQQKSNNFATTVAGEDADYVRVRRGRGIWELGDLGMKATKGRVVIIWIGGRYEKGARIRGCGNMGRSLGSEPITESTEDPTRNPFSEFYLCDCVICVSPSVIVFFFIKRGKKK